MWIWQRPGWPTFGYDARRFDSGLVEYRLRADRLAGAVALLPPDERQDALLDLLVSEAIKTSAIEGEPIDRTSVRSSIKAHLGLAPKETASRDPRADGIAALVASVRERFAQPLDATLLGTWQTMAIPDRPSSLAARGTYRRGESPMLIVSGYVGKQRVHYEAPPSARVPEEMARFLAWYNATRPQGSDPQPPGPVRAAIAHLWFESIHPFDDGNGRVGRAIADHAIAQDLGYPPLSCLATCIEADKKTYYALLERTQRGGLRIDDWLAWFVETVLRAQDLARVQVDFTVEKARYFDRYRTLLNERQHKAVARMFAAGPAGFEGGMTAGKYVGIAGCSKATATRDLAALVRIGALTGLPGSGRATRYALTRLEIRLE
jgi:Fic family protein